jgi:hypothetical protein
MTEIGQWGFFFLGAQADGCRGVFIFLFCVIGVPHCSAANRSLEEKYQLNLPSYPGSAQIVELETENGEKGEV